MQRALRATAVSTLALAAVIAVPAAGRSAGLPLPALSLQRHNAGPGWLSAEARSGTDLVYVGSATGQFVGVYEQRGNHKQVGSITQGVYYPSACSSTQSVICTSRTYSAEP
jgi:hypothetical protein